MDSTDIQEQFKKKRTRQFVVLGLMLPIIIAIFLSKESESGLFLGLTYDQIGKGGVGFIICCLIFSFINWRCPSCKSYLGRSLFIKVCSNCREVLR